MTPEEMLDLAKGVADSSVIEESALLSYFTETIDHPRKRWTRRREIRKAILQYRDRLYNPAWGDQDIFLTMSEREQMILNLIKPLLADTNYNWKNFTHKWDISPGNPVLAVCNMAEWQDLGGNFEKLGDQLICEPAAFTNQPVGNDPVTEVY